LSPLTRGWVSVESADAVFARMLTLELEKISVPCSGEQPPALRVLDADSVSSEQTGRDGIPAIVFSRRPGKFPEGVTVLQRPFPIRAFVEAVLHLLHEGDVSSMPSHLLTHFPLQLSLNGGGEVTFMGEKIMLTAQEYALLDYLWQNRGRPVGRGEAIEQVWKYDYTGNSNVVDVYIRYLREKLEKDSGVRLIRTVRGKGYMIE